MKLNLNIVPYLDYFAIMDEDGELVQMNGLIVSQETKQEMLSWIYANYWDLIKQYHPQFK